MELLRFYFMIIFCAFVDAQILQEPLFASDDPMASFAQADYRSSFTFAAVRDITIRPFRKRPPTLQYQVELHDETFNISLMQNLGLSSPGCLVQHYDLNGQKNLYPCNRHKLECYYTGKSDSHNDSWVAADACNGLRGVLSIGNSSYFFDPMNSNSSKINGGHVHTVYRFQGNKDVCAVTNAGLYQTAFHNKRKRDVVDMSQTKYVETRVVLDPDMVLYHGSSDKAEQYAYMAFNIANKVFMHRSLGQVVQLVISEFQIIERFNDFASSLTPDADETLDKFCKWQQKLASPFEFDANVLFTRMDLRDKVSSSVNGLSYTRGMCTKHLNCVLVEDQGPIVGITLAHEIGHLLGMNHNTNETGIMNTGGWSGQQAFEWSKASASEFHAFATEPSDPLKCLKNMPSGQESNKKEPIPPGYIFSADEQCKLMHNKSAYFVQNERQDVCDKLYCGTYGSDVVIVSSSPLVDWTDCYNNRSWCVEGQCVPMAAKFSRVLPIDGAWSEWGPYTQCSRTCDGGVQITRRICNNPMPQFGGKDCSGSTEKGKVCNLEACNQWGNADRTRQCLAYQSPNVTMICNDVASSSSCVYTLWNSITNFWKQLRYEDGTECFLNDFPYNRCVEGQCWSFGCDGMSDSTTVYDKCRICNGTGTSCDMHTGSYDNDGVYKAYVDVVTIPKFSSNIMVDQWNRYCFLSISVNGKRIFNDNGHKNESFAATLFGIQLRYSTLPERIQIFAKIPTDIVIQVYRKYDRQHMNVSPNVSYTFYTESPMQYAWAIVHNGTCSKACGTGQQTDDIVCMGRSGSFVDDLYCGIENRPNQVFKPCNTHACPPRWEVSPWSNCSASCGFGRKSRNVTCISETNSTTVVLDDSKCQHLKHPTFESKCYENNCSGTWGTGNWSECSTTCGEGCKRRDVTCWGRIDQHRFQLMPADCPQTDQPSPVETCKYGPCYVASKPGETCKDVLENCVKFHASGALICDASNSKDCKRTCGVCSNKTCNDQPVCESFVKGDCTTNVTKMPWLFQNCPQKCGVCDEESSCFDHPDCYGYDAKLCNDPIFVRWMYRNCPQTCGVCRDCMDCSNIDCNDPSNVDGMKKYCARTCKLC